MDWTKLVANALLSAAMGAAGVYCVHVITAPGTATRYGLIAILFVLANLLGLLQDAPTDTPIG